MHAKQAEQCMRAGKHVMIEIPLRTTLPTPTAAEGAEGNGRYCDGRHTAASIQPSVIHQRISGGLKIQQMDVQTYFFRVQYQRARQAA